MFPLIEEDENSEDLNVATGASCPQAPGKVTETWKLISHRRDH